MAEYIEREAALAALCRDCSKMVPSNEREPCRYRFTGCTDYYNIFELAAADVRPVVHGHWKRPKTINGRVKCFICSACGIGQVFRTSFCPNCGAKMDGGADNA